MEITSFQGSLFGSWPWLAGAFLQPVLSRLKPELQLWWVGTGEGLCTSELVCSPLMHCSSFNKSCYLLVQDMSGPLCLPSPPISAGFFLGMCPAFSLPTSSEIVCSWRSCLMFTQCYSDDSPCCLLKTRPCSKSSWMLRKARTSQRCRKQIKLTVL